MERLGSEVRRALAAFPSTERGETLATTARAWAAAVGPEIARVTAPRRLARDGTLHVATASSIWAFELDRLGPEILARLRADGACGAITALRFAPGPVAEPGADPGGDPDPDAAAVRAREIRREDVEEAERAAAAIDDPTLRELAARAVASSLAAGRSRRPF